MAATIIFLGDGMADEAIADLGNRTPLQYANTPAMDSIARDGCSGTLLTLPEGFPTSSDVANMSVLGCVLEQEFCGRGPLEAAGRNIRLAADDIAFRVNLTSVRDGVLTDFSGGHTEQTLANELIDLLNGHFGSGTVRFHAGVSYRNILVLSGPEFSDRVKTEKPDDNSGERVADHRPVATDPAGNATADFLNHLIDEAPALLEASPSNKRLGESGKAMVNGVWPWSGGSARALRSLKDKYDIGSSAVISAVDVIVGLGRCLGMQAIEVPHATGYIDTNWDGKAAAAIEALKTHEFVYLHVEAIDEVSHEQNQELKLQSIETFDAKIVGPVLEAIGPGVNVAVLPDHPVPLSIGKHTRTPVPVSVRMQGQAADEVQVFDEEACKAGSLGQLENGDLMELLFGPARA